MELCGWAYGQYHTLFKVLDFLYHHDYMDSLISVVIEQARDVVQFSHRPYVESPDHYEHDFEELVSILPREKDFRMVLTFTFYEGFWQEVTKELERYHMPSNTYVINGFRIYATVAPNPWVHGDVLVTLIFTPDL